MANVQNANSVPVPQKKEVAEETKLMSFRVPVDVYWQFKSKAAARKERMDTAGLNAALLYIDCDGGDGND